MNVLYSQNHRPKKRFFFYAGATTTIKCVKFGLLVTWIAFISSSVYIFLYSHDPVQEELVKESPIFVHHHHTSQPHEHVRNLISPPTTATTRNNKSLKDTALEMTVMTEPESESSLTDQKAVEKEDPIMDTDTTPHDADIDTDTHHDGKTPTMDYMDNQTHVFQIDQRVNVRYKADNKIYPARILRFHKMDNTYDVEYEEGSYREKYVSACDIHKYQQLWSCSSDTTPYHHPKHLLARFVIFQRDLRFRLRHLVSHYTSILPYESLVIINHAGTDITTLNDLKHYAHQGAHVWNCTGEFRFKGDMWTAVIKEYINSSDFIFPLDGDEYLTIFQKDADGRPSLRWTYDDLVRELLHMDRNGEVGKPFKMLKSIPFPSDCDLSDDLLKKHLMKATGEQVQTSSTTERFSSSRQIHYTSSDMDQYCYNKCAYRGTDFIGVDSGNHGLDQFVVPCRKEYGFSRITKDAWPIDPSAANNTFNLSNLTLLHFQLTEFSDYLENGLRGSTDYEINKNGLAAYDCDDLSKGGAYCKKWNKFLNVSLDYYKMKALYHEEACQVFDPTLSYLLPIHHIFTSDSAW